MHPEHRFDPQDGLDVFRRLNRYMNELFGSQDEVLTNILRSIEVHGLPPISVSPATGKLLTMLVAISGAKRVLEIGALGGYSGVCLARGMGPEGTLTSLELVEDYARLAQHHLEKAGFGSQVTYIIGPALESLKTLVMDRQHFDFFFIDADKDNYVNYLDYCIQLAEPGAIIVADNTLAGSGIGSPRALERRGEIMKQFNETVALHPQLDAMFIPIGDGVTVARVKE
ncbi:O-methyltransferase [Geobacillus thermodenitrificans]|jgi:caffeoyl-CoA O-methyltransferase|uniref:O-methyltransferase n=1 Tax=Geobacillus thermodenitrificans TaxID=33940 RepID=UPI000D371463|nr:O-methyltransferase [Geobacillus thermodenitrificans]PTR47244.1 methyltransferase [Geobacillus thermodenitrificans]